MIIEIIFRKIEGFLMKRRQSSNLLAEAPAYKPRVRPSPVRARHDHERGILVWNDYFQQRRRMFCLDVSVLLQGYMGQHCSISPAARLNIG
jgi:hypothetical protein